MYVCVYIYIYIYIVARCARGTPQAAARSSRGTPRSAAAAAAAAAAFEEHAGLYNTIQYNAMLYYNNIL